MVAHGAVNFLQALPGGWQVRLAGNAQLTDTPLVASEQFGLTGANAVRGFDERAVVADSGLVLSAELYTPELGARLGLPDSTNVASAGVGTRYSLSRDFSVRLDVARVLESGSSFTEKRGDWRAHLSATFAF